MAFDPYDPWLNFGINMMAAGAPSRDPRSASLGWALAQGLGGVQGAQGIQQDLRYRQALQQRWEEELRKQEEERKRKQQQQQAAAGVFAQQPVGKMRVDNVGSGFDMDVMAPPTPKDIYGRVGQLAQTDPSLAMEMQKFLGQYGVPGQMPPPEAPDLLNLIPKEDLPRVARIKHGLEPTATSAENLQLREAGLDLREQALGLQRERINRGDSSAPQGDLSKAETNKRNSISRARGVIARMNVDRPTAEQMSKTDAAFKALLELANQRMPGDDPAWDSTMQRRTRATKATTARTKQAAVATWQLQYRTTKDKKMKERLRQKLTEAGYPPKD
jgi:hypothetical protein